MGALPNVSAIGAFLAIHLGAATAFGSDAEIIPLGDVLARSSHTRTTSNVPKHPRHLGVADVYALQRIAALPNAQFNLLAFGDTDHDGFNEIIFWWKEFLNPGTILHYRIMEEQGQNVYTTEHIGPDFTPHATGDLDHDGRSEIVGQYGGQIHVYESPSATTYPTELVWTSTVMTNVGNIAAVGDTDRDGKMEILWSENSFSGRGNIFHIFENVGDNSFGEVFTTTIPDGGVGTKAVADFDSDGLMEIAFFSGGPVYVFESHADDVWALTWSDTTELEALSDADESGIDSDGNGRPEFYVTGNGPRGWTTLIFEAVCDNTFREITSVAQDDGSYGVPHSTIARFDGDAGPVSFLMVGEYSFWVYQPVAQGRWELVGQFLDPDESQHRGLYALDVNRNGRDELFWTTESVFGHETLVLEKPMETPVDPWVPVPLLQFAITPNPIRSHAVILLPMAVPQPGMYLAVYDVCGRLVQRSPCFCGPDGTWTWPSELLSSGVYFVRLDDGQGRNLGATRVTVLR